MVDLSMAMLNNQMVYHLQGDAPQDKLVYNPH